jgi:hypothetical protein
MPIGIGGKRHITFEKGSDLCGGSKDGLVIQRVAAQLRDEHPESG